MSTEISELAEAGNLVAGAPRVWRSFAAIIYHPVLPPEPSRQQIETLCQETVQYGFACVFVNPTHAALAVSLLSGSSIKVGVPIGFPLGASLTTSKRQETLDTLRLGAQEFDMVMNIGALKSGDRDVVLNDIKSVAEVVHDAGAILKVI